MPDHLNIFEPYRRKGPTHEDALTRAFLLVLRGVPVAHAAWLHLVDQAHRANEGSGVPHLHELSAPQVFMQTSTVPEGVERMISLVQTDEHVPVPKDAKSSERRQVLDGVVAYQDLAIVIENKPWHRNIWTGQLNVNVEEGVIHDTHVACVTWKNIVVAWSRLLEAGHLGTAETVLLNDFLDYVEEHFPALRPYSKVKLCGNDPGRLARRCKAVLEALTPEAPERVDRHRGWGHYLRLDTGGCATQIGFFPANRGRSLVLDLAPADTGAQAKVLYGSVDYEAVATLLEGERWSGQTNFHLGHVTSNLFHKPSPLTLDAYWAVWVAQRRTIRRWRKPEFDDAWAFLQQHQVVEPNLEVEWQATTTRTARKTIDIRPGIRLRWTLLVEEAVILDERGQLENVVKAAIQEVAEALNLRLPWPSSEPG